MARDARVVARTLTSARALLVAATAAFAGGFGALAVLQQRAFETGRFDVGNVTQAVWATAHGDFLTVTDLGGRQISRLGAHFDPIVAVFVPLWWIWPHPSALLVAQAVAVALGAVPVFRLARRRLGSAHAGLGLALVYLLYPPTQWLVLDDVHPVAFATPLLLAAWDFLDEERLVPFAAAAGAACLTKEHIGLVVAMMGVWYAVAKGERRVGAVIAIAATGVAVVAIAIVVPHFAPGGGSPFADRYADVGGTPGGILDTAVHRPGAIVASATERRDVDYLVALLAPVAGLPLLAPLALIVALPELATNVLSGTVTQTSIHFHYTAATIAALMAATIFGAARAQSWLGRRAELVPRALVAVTLIAGVVQGPNPLWSHVPFGEDLGADAHVVTAHDRIAQRALRLVPGSAPVSASNTLGAHLSARSRIYSFPLLGGADWVAVDTTRLSYLDAVGGGAKARDALRRLRADRHWRVVFDADGILVLQRS
jgi:uncharacterized membrane protein